MLFHLQFNHLFFFFIRKKKSSIFSKPHFFLVFKISNKFDNKIEVTLIENKFNTKKEKVIQNFDNRIILQIFNYSILLQKLKPPHEWSSPIFLFLLITCIIRSCLLFFLLYFRFIANYMLFCVVLEFFFFFNYIIFGIILVMFGKFLSFNEYSNSLYIWFKTLGLYAFKYYPIYTSVL